MENTANPGNPLPQNNVAGPNATRFDLQAWLRHSLVSLSMLSGNPLLAHSISQPSQLQIDIASMCVSANPQGNVILVPVVVSADGPVEPLSKSDAEEPKRPVNSFMCFRAAMYPILREQYPNKNSRDIVLIISSYWREASPEIKSYFRKEAAAIRAEHKKTWPDYQYNKPSKKPAVASEIPATPLPLQLQGKGTISINSSSSGSNSRGSSSASRKKSSVRSVANKTPDPRQLPIDYPGSLIEQVSWNALGSLHPDLGAPVLANQPVVASNSWNGQASQSTESIAESLESVDTEPPGRWAEWALPGSFAVAEGNAAGWVVSMNHEAALGSSSSSSLNSSSFSLHQPDNSIQAMSVLEAAVAPQPFTANELAAALELGSAQPSLTESSTKMSVLNWRQESELLQEGSALGSVICSGAPAAGQVDANLLTNLGFNVSSHLGLGRTGESGSGNRTQTDAKQYGIGHGMDEGGAVPEPVGHSDLAESTIAPDTHDQNEAALPTESSTLCSNVVETGAVAPGETGLEPGAVSLISKATERLTDQSRSRRGSFREKFASLNPSTTLVRPADHAEQVFIHRPITEMVGPISSSLRRYTPRSATSSDLDQLAESFLHMPSPSMQTDGSASASKLFTPRKGGIFSFPAPALAFPSNRISPKPPGLSPPGYLTRALIISPSALTRSPII